MIKEALSIRRIGESLANAVHMKTSPICVYGSDRAPENAIRSSRINSCLAQSMYEIAEGRIQYSVYAEGEGFVAEMDTRALGMAVVSMGGGRRQASDLIDYSVGFTDVVRLGARIDAQQPLAVIHAKDENSWQEAAKAVKAAIKLDDKAPEITPTVYRRITE